MEYLPIWLTVLWFLLVLADCKMEVQYHRVENVKNSSMAISNIRVAKINRNQHGLRGNITFLKDIGNNYLVSLTTCSENLETANTFELNINYRIFSFLQKFIIVPWETISLPERRTSYQYWAYVTLIATC